jgi:hypothetical protein
MASINSIADVFRDWEGLNEAALRTQEIQAAVEPERLALLDSVAECQGLKARQEELGGERQEVTQQLKAAVARGKEKAIRLRSVIRGKIGPRNERLVHFRVAPLRPRGPRKATAPVKPPETEPAESPTKPAA